MGTVLVCCVISSKSLFGMISISSTYGTGLKSRMRASMNLHKKIAGGGMVESDWAESGITRKSRADIGIYNHGHNILEF